eukprot:TRINITY_DN10580_c0_g1_i1.p1 TRINITY_DN10580_c0_g1~~TRINITY_DN10580_c0_g1_i1.p1  ORF type:complete len:350 (-),score=58.71 TRINITY_DN10580_c0_g1_i1:38-1087(-)
MAEVKEECAVSHRCELVSFHTSDSHISRIVNYLKEHPRVHEVISTGEIENCQQIWVLVRLIDAEHFEQYLEEICSRPNFRRNVMRIFPIRRITDKLQDLYEEPELHQYSFRVHAYPMSVKNSVGPHLEEMKIPMDPRDGAFTHHLSVMQFTDGTYGYDFVPARIPLYEHTMPSLVISRAYYKLQEVFEFVLRDENINFSELKAMDIGASPGGWTQYLAFTRNCKLVAAVDPGEMHMHLNDKPNVKHYKQRAEDALSSLEGDAPYDMLMCDMNLTSQDAVEKFSSLAALLRPGAVLVFTMKYTGKSRNEEKLDQQAMELATPLSSQYRDFRVVWLFGNSVRERTIIAYKI